MTSRPPRNQQRQLYEQVLQKYQRFEQELPTFRYRDGDQYCVVSDRWYRVWKTYTDPELLDDVNVPEPGSIQNEELLYRGSKDYLKIGRSNVFSLIPRECFQMFQNWYGGGPEIVRQCIGGKVDVYPLFLQLSIYDGTTPIPNLSKKEFKTSGEIAWSQFHQNLLKTVQEETKQSNPTFRIWACIGGEPYRLFDLSQLQNQLLKHSITRIFGQHLLVEVQQEGKFVLDGRYNHLWNKLIKSKSNQKEIFSAQKVAGPAARAGICGLIQLGNTCYMNSALQVLTKVPQLRDYFLNDRYLQDLNETNPDGYKGELAKAFGKIMKEMWSGSHSYLVPRDFKRVIEKLNKQYVGFQQHDASELIRYLLDGLHEELNRVKTSETNGELLELDENLEDEEAAKLTHDHYLKKNDSFILDHFQGLMKQEITCPECGTTSKSFVPFFYLHLPLPELNTRKLEISLKFHKNSQAPVRYLVTVDSKGTVKQLRSNLSQLCGVPEHKLVIADIASSEVYAYLSDSHPIVGINARDLLWAFEVPDLKPSVFSDERLKSPAMIQVKFATPRNVVSYQQSVVFKSIVNVMPPMIFPFNDKVTNKELYDYCLTFIRRFLKPSARRKFKFNKPENFLPFDQSLIPPLIDSDDEEEPERTLEDNLFVLRTGFEDTDVILNYDQTVTSTLMPPYNTDRPQQTSIYLHVFPDVLKNYLSTEALDSMEQHPSTLNTKTEEINLRQCFREMSKPTTIEGSYYCAKCKKMVDATHTMKIWKVPKVLVVLIKRFNSNGYTSYKIKRKVEYPVDDLDLSNFIEGPQSKEKLTYDLFAVSNHIGDVSGGHYTADCKIGSQWYHYDDQDTKKVNSSRVVTNKGYVLFYKMNEDEPR